MQRSLLKALLASSALVATVGLAKAEPVFNRIASFPVASNLSADADPATVTSSEIITVSQDGNTLVYSDSPAGGIGMVDITDPKAPKAGGFIDLSGEPTSVAIALSASTRRRASPTRQAASPSSMSPRRPKSPPAIWAVSRTRSPSPRTASSSPSPSRTSATKI